MPALHLVLDMLLLCRASSSLHSLTPQQLRRINQPHSNITRVTVLCTVNRSRWGPKSSRVPSSGDKTQPRLHAVTSWCGGSSPQTWLKMGHGVHKYSESYNRRQTFNPKVLTDTWILNWYFWKTTRVGFFILRAGKLKKTSIYPGFLGGAR